VISERGITRYSLVARAETNMSEQTEFYLSEWILLAVEFTLRYTGIRVTDLDRALEFYSEILGMKLVTRIKVPETNGELAIVKSEGVDHWLEINWYADQKYSPGDELDHIAFQVANLDEALSYLKSKGIEPISYVRESKNSRWTYIPDPDGNWIEIYEEKH